MGIIKHIPANGGQTNGRGRHLAILVVITLAFTALLGCAAQQPKDDPRTFQKPLIWPPPPEPARVTYLRSIETADDIGANKGFFKRVIEALLGSVTEEIIKPYGVTVDIEGRMIVADPGLKKIHIFDIKNNKYSSIDDAGSKELRYPVSVASDALGNIYVTDSVVGKVDVYNRRGSFLFDFDAGTRPTGIAIDRAEKIVYVTDTGLHQVNKFSIDGKLIGTIGKWGAAAGEFNHPVDIAVDASGDVYVADTMNYRIQIFDKTGRFVLMFGKQGDGSGNLGRPKGVGVDREGNIYVADALFDTVQIFNRNGDYLLNFGSIGKEAGKFWLPCGIYIDNGEKIYIADSYNKRVQIFEYLGGGVTLN